LYPLIIDALGKGKLSVGPPYFQAVFVPLMIPMVFFMGIGPIARWKKASLPDIAVRLRWAFGAGIVTAIILPFILGKWTPMISVGILMATWIIASLITSFSRTIKRSKELGGRGLRGLSRSYYGMQLAHFGVAVFILGITLVKGYETEKDVRMDLGDTTSVGGYVFRFDGVVDSDGPNYTAKKGFFQVSKNNREIMKLTPEKRIYTVQQMPMTEAAIDTGLFRDLYVSLGEPVSGGAWSVRIYNKPFVDWICGGCVLMALGGLLAITDRRYRLAVRKQQQPAPHDRLATASPNAVARLAPQSKG